MTLTKTDLVQAVVDRTGFPLKRWIGMVESLLDIMKRVLESSEDVLVSGFGKFAVKDKSQRRRRNPATGEDIMLPDRLVVMFRCLGKLRQAIKDDLRPALAGLIFFWGIQV